MDGGEWVDRSEGRRISLREALLRYEKEILPGKAPRNQVAERRRIHALQERRIARTALANITPAAISSYIKKRQDEGVANNTIRLALATAMRRGEIADLTWDCVSIDRRSAHLPVTKNGHARTVPLSSAAVAVLEFADHRGEGRVFGPNEHTITKPGAMSARRWSRSSGKLG